MIRDTRTPQQLDAALHDIASANLKHRIWYAEVNKVSPLPSSDGNWRYDGDVHVPADKPLPILFMGFNPGDGNGAQKPGMSRSERAWRTRCSRLANIKADRIVFAELITIPTRTQGGLAGYSLEMLMKGALDLNLAIIRFHRPAVIFQSGISQHHLDIIRTLYGLDDEEIVNRPDRTETLLKSYRMKEGPRWIAFRHFASPGFSNADREAIQGHAAKYGWQGET